MCLLSSPRGSCVLGSREWEAKGKTESNLKESFIHCLCLRSARRLFGSLWHCCCIVAFANTASKSKGGERERKFKIN